LGNNAVALQPSQARGKGARILARRRLVLDGFPLLVEAGIVRFEAPPLGRLAGSRIDAAEPPAAALAVAILAEDARAQATEIVPRQVVAVEKSVQGRIALKRPDIEANQVVVYP
jgi:hypothetical protein